MNKTERESLQLMSVRQWEAERQARIDGYATALAHLNAALAVIPTGDAAAHNIAGMMRSLPASCRGRMRAIFDEPNPFVGERKQA